jgi:hypothetical protein
MEFEIVKNPCPMLMLKARVQMAEALLTSSWAGEELEQAKERILQKLCSLEPTIAEMVEVFRSENQ